MYIHRKWISFIFEALKHQNCLKYKNYLRKQLCSSIFCTIRMLNTDECFLFIFGVLKIIRHVSNIAIIYEGNMLRCTNHVKSIHSNFVISRNHWPVLTMLTVWGDKTNRISQIWSLFHHHTSPQDVHPRIRSTGQSESQQHTYHSVRRGTVYGEWHLVLPLRKVTVPRTNRSILTYQDDPCCQAVKRNYNEQAKRIAFQIAQAYRAWAIIYHFQVGADNANQKSYHDENST